MRIVSLFSGAGGLDLGLIQAGHEIVWANDFDKDCVATYKKNIGNHAVLGDNKKKLTQARYLEGRLLSGDFRAKGFLRPTF